MSWNFEQMVSFAQQFQASGREGFELAFVLSEWTPGGGLALADTYPAERSIIAPTEVATGAQADRIFIKINSGSWQQLSQVASVTDIGIGQSGVLTSGIDSSMVVVGWQSKGIAAGYIIAPSSTIDQINTDRETGLALIRIIVDAEEDEHPLGPDTLMTGTQVALLSTWLNNHNITNEEFAALFDLAPAQLSSYLTTLPRWRFAQEIHTRFSGG